MSSLDRIPGLRAVTPAGAAVVALAVGELVTLSFQGWWQGPAAGVSAAAGASVLLVRRRWPLSGATLPFVGLAAALSLEPEEPSAVFIGLMVSFAVVAAVSTTSVGVVGWATGTVLVIVTAYTSDPGAWLADAALTTVFCSVMWGAGWLVGHRTREATVSRLRAEAAELAGELALREQRDQLARELHDVVSHGLSVVVLQTTAARVGLTDRLSPDDVDRHLAAVEETARAALEEMRRMLDLLQTSELETDGLERPSLPALLERATSAGLRVDASAVESLDLPLGLALTLHRVLQEALTNAAKHAPGASVRVCVHAADDQVVVQVDDDGATSPTTPGLTGGSGLPGMARRLELYGGTLETGPSGIGGFRVRAVIPYATPDRVHGAGRVGLDAP